MNDFEIEILEEDLQNENNIQLPVNFLQIGEVTNDDVKIYIKQDVYQKLEEYASSDTLHELGTIIVGNYSDSLGKINVVISDFIYAKYTDASASTLTFTHKTWEYIHKEHEEKYADKKIIGWQHTHPSYGIFLSNYDIFIQENFFNLPFQVAYVIDPVQNLRGFFQWKNGKIEKVNGFYIYDDLGKKIKISSIKQNKNKEASKKVNNSSGTLNTVVWAVSFLILFGVVLFSGILNSKYNRQLVFQERLEKRIATQEEELKRKSDEIESMKNAFEDFVVDKNKEEITTNETTTNKTESEEQITSAVDEGITLLSYIVEEGDTLYEICNKNNIDYSSTYKVILGINGIEDANQIMVGQMILLPISK